ncbi:MAG: hypothetical protein AMXMBFR33_09910 [Candidatus Xenobia bacterium]
MHILAQHVSQHIPRFAVAPALDQIPSQAGLKDWFASKFGGKKEEPPQPPPTLAPQARPEVPKPAPVKVDDPRLKPILERMESIGRTFGEEDMTWQPADRWSYRASSNQGTYVPEDLVGKSDDYVIGKALQESALARYSHYSAEPELAQNEAFNYLANSVEEPAVSEIVSSRHLGARSYVKEVYQEDILAERGRIRERLERSLVEESGGKLTAEQARAVVDKSGLGMPKHVQYGNAIMRDWFTGGEEDPDVTDPSVKKALQETLPDAREAIRIKREVFRDDLSPMEVREQSQERYQTVKEKLYPAYQRLLQDDQQSLQQALQQKGQQGKNGQQSQQGQQSQNGQQSQQGQQSQNGQQSQQSQQSQNGQQSQQSQQSQNGQQASGSQQAQAGQQMQRAGQAMQGQKGMEQAGQQLEQAGQSMQSGDPQQAAEQMRQAAEQLKNNPDMMKQALEELKNNPEARKAAEEALKDNPEAQKALQQAMQDPAMQQKLQQELQKQGGQAGRKLEEAAEKLDQGQAGQKEMQEAGKQLEELGKQLGNKKLEDAGKQMQGAGQETELPEMTAEEAKELAKKALERFNKELNEQMESRDDEVRRGGQAPPRVSPQQQGTPQSSGPRPPQPSEPVPAQPQPPDPNQKEGGDGYEIYDPGVKLPDLEELIKQKQEMEAEWEKQRTTYDRYHSQVAVYSDELAGELRNFLRETERPKYNRTPTAKGKKLSLKGAMRAEAAEERTGRTQSDIWLDRTKPTRRGIEFVFILDGSGSMLGERWTSLLKGMVLSAEALDSLDINFGVVEYADNSQVMKGIKDRYSVEGRNKLMAAIEQPFSGGNNERVGMQTALDLFEAQGTKGYKKVMVLITDGICDIAPVKELTEKARDKKITVIGVGIGAEMKQVEDTYDDSVLVEHISKLPFQLADMVRQQVEGYDDEFA